MANISVRESRRRLKTIDNITVDHLKFTLNKDIVVISLDTDLCKEFEDREGLMEKLYKYLNSASRKAMLRDKLND